VSLDHCLFKKCSKGCLTASQSDRILIAHCRFVTTGFSCILLDGPIALIKHSTIKDCDGNAINANRGAKVMLSHCTMTGCAYPPLAICDDSLGMVQHCTITDSKMSGIIVRNGSRATIADCTLQRIKQVGIAASDSSEVDVSGTSVMGCQEATVASYNQSRLKLSSCFLLGTGRFGIDVFTGGTLSATDTAITGMTECCMWVHHGGSIHFVSGLLDIFSCDSREVLLERIRSASTGRMDLNIPDNKLFRVESKRPFAISRAFVVGKGSINITQNESAPLPLPGIAAVPATCTVCHGSAVDCFYSLCGHTVYCKACWVAMPEKPVVCELCLMPIEKVCGPINCSHEDDEQICGICFTEQVDSMVLPCGHLICSQCGRKWFAEHTECPYCREKLARFRTFVSYA
jgi:hypothetical protein